MKAIKLMGKWQRHCYRNLGLNIPGGYQNIHEMLLMLGFFFNGTPCRNVV